MPTLTPEILDLMNSLKQEVMKTIPTLQKALSPKAPRNFIAMLCDGQVPMSNENKILVWTFLGLEFQNSEDKEFLLNIKASFLNLQLESFKRAHQILLEKFENFANLNFIFLNSYDSDLNDYLIFILVELRATLKLFVYEHAAFSNDDEILDLIGGNIEICAQSESVCKLLAGNKHFSKSSKNRLFEDLVRNGIFHDGLTETAEAILRLNPQEREKAVEKIDLSNLKIDSLLNNNENLSISEVEDESEQIERDKTIYQMSIPQKIALALKGNKTARLMLMKSPNKIIAVAAISNPRVTEPEVIKAAKSKHIHEEVIRVISKTKEMTRSYNVKKALVENPKTPQATAMTFLPHIRAHDLKQISKSRDVPSAIAQQAKRMIERRKPKDKKR